MFCEVFFHGLHSSVLTGRVMGMVSAAAVAPYVGPGSSYRKLGKSRYAR